MSCTYAPKAEPTLGGTQLQTVNRKSRLIIFQLVTWFNSAEMGGLSQCELGTIA